MIPGRVAELVAQASVRALGEQGLHQCSVSGSRSKHQRRGTDGGVMVRAVRVRLPQQVLEVLALVWEEMALTGGRHGLAGQSLDLLPFAQAHPGRERGSGAPELTLIDQPLGRREVRVAQSRDPRMLAVPQSVVEHQLARLVAGILRIQSLWCHLLYQFTAPGIPGHGLVLEVGLSNGLRLFFLALHFELARLLCPLLAGGRSG